MTGQTLIQGDSAPRAQGNNWWYFWSVYVTLLRRLTAPSTVDLRPATMSIPYHGLCGSWLRRYRCFRCSWRASGHDHCFLNSHRTCILPRRVDLGPWRRPLGHDNWLSSTSIEQNYLNSTARDPGSATYGGSKGCRDVIEATSNQHSQEPLVYLPTAWTRQP